MQTPEFFRLLATFAFIIGFWYVAKAFITWRRSRRPLPFEPPKDPKKLRGYVETSLELTKEPGAYREAIKRIWSSFGLTMEQLRSAELPADQLQLAEQLLLEIEADKRSSSPTAAQPAA